MFVMNSKYLSVSEESMLKDLKSYLSEPENATFLKVNIIRANKIITFVI